MTKLTLLLLLFAYNVTSNSLLSFVLSAASLQLHRLQKFTSPIPSVVRELVFCSASLDTYSLRKWLIMRETLAPFCAGP
jgi:hypothetical protein